MMEFSLWKKLKKRFRRKRRPMWMLGCMLLSLLIGWLIPIHTVQMYAFSPEQSDFTQMLLEKEKPWSVKLHRVYVCGDEIKPLGIMMTDQIQQLMKENPKWKGKLGNESNTVFLEQHVDDLSEHCKANAYMGLDKKGNLTLYDGVPKKEKVVRTFFQLDVHYLESSLPQDKLDQLAKGIRISDIDEYNSVLSTYSDYAIELNQKVMKPAY
ncbi:forespore regulator of the sigma-K checkpoint [Paenibacillus castaneae]|uniref:BofC C-terminal domain-containing protein n=1 Tax=Paenibacillus castaneae TaxID=474957 RepID=UPI000C9AB2DE|nr:BofC C-terminal domain-containing protein [Paenibacillus castaneae]NIK75950.1 forespore regulator of the sigma-K checkpoint [Paenibacillus castaneae]